MNVKIFSALKSWQGSLVYGYLTAMFSIFLFFFRNQYFDITPAKYAFFQTVTLIFIGAGMILSCLLFICAKPKPSSIISTIRNLSITDWGFLLMLSSHIITTVVCAYPKESLSGIDGRQSGLIFTFLITSMYFLVSRWYQQETSVIIIYLVCSSLVVGLGILNFYGFDPLQFNSLLSTDDILRYLSTTGNIQFFAHLICLSLPISVVLFTHTEGKGLRALYAILTIFGFMGLFISNIDGGFLGIFAFMAFYLFYSLSSYEKLKKYLQVVLIALYTGKILSAISSFFPETVRSFSTLSAVATSSSLSTILLIVTTFIYVLYIRYEKQFSRLNFKHLRAVYIVVLGGCGLIIVGLIYYMSIVDTTTEFAGLSNYFRYNDAWGSNRGFVWNNLLSVYGHDFDFVGKLFGSGLDTVRNIFLNSTQVYEVAHYDNAHNEYIQYLVTSGIFGLITYATLFFSIQVRLYTYRNSEPWILAILCCLIAHGAQALTGLNQPITTPLLYILIALGENLLRKKKKELPFENASKHTQENRF